jgi:hypothetical protein
MKRLLLVACLFFATCTVAEAQVYGAFGFAPYGGFGRYYTPPVNYRPYRYRSNYYGSHHHHYHHGNRRYCYAY